VEEDVAQLKKQMTVVSNDVKGIKSELQTMGEQLLKSFQLQVQHSENINQNIMQQGQQINSLFASIHPQAPLINWMTQTPNLQRKPLPDILQPLPQPLPPLPSSLSSPSSFDNFSAPSDPVSPTFNISDEMSIFPITEEKSTSAVCDKSHSSYVPINSTSALASPLHD
jgi:hypothetical protein